MAQRSRVLAAVGRRFFRRRGLVYLALWVGGTMLALLPFRDDGAPLPTVQDEFANLLIAHTLLDGRLANPPHPMAKFFETFHVLQSPTYVGKYPPGEGLQLALGEALTGQPVAGVWLTVGLLAVAWCWLAEAAAPRWLAAPLSLAVTTYYAAATYWGGSYWGGSLFALAGALALGGAARLARWPDRPVGAAAWAGVGAGLALLTRPYEGFFFCLAPAAAILWTLLRRTRKRPGGTRRMFAALAAGGAPLAAAGAFTLLYNHATTGSAFLFAHQLYEETVMPDRGLFLWDTLHPPTQPRHPTIDEYFRTVKSGQWGQANFTAWDVLTRVWKVDLRMVGGMFLPWWMWPPVLAGALLAGRRRGGPARLALATMASLFAVLFTLRYFFYPHYAAAWTAVFVLLAATGWRHAAHLSRWVPVTRAPLAAAALAAAAFIAWDYGQYAAAAGSLLNVMAADHGERDFWRFRMFELPMLDRATFEEKLAVRAAGTGRGQVAIIEYPPKYFHDIEWVYNGPDIDQQPVIFARSWDPVADAALRAYYPNRDLWRVRLASNGQLQSFTLWNP